MDNERGKGTTEKQKQMIECNRKDIGLLFGEARGRRNALEVEIKVYGYAQLKKRKSKDEVFEMVKKYIQPTISKICFFSQFNIS